VYLILGAIYKRLSRAVLVFLVLKVVLEVQGCVQDVNKFQVQTERGVGAEKANTEGALVETVDACSTSEIAAIAHRKARLSWN